MKIIVLLAFYLVASSHQVAMACSSCGSGAVDPIILFPNENHKLYLGINQQSRIRDVSSTGDIKNTAGIQEKQVTTVSAASRILRSQGFISLTGSFVTNSSSEYSSMGYGDPLLALRYNILNQSFTKPLVPQIQIITSHKFARNSSIHESTDPELLDIYGSGFHETSFGGDLWFGMLPIKFGASLLYTLTHKDVKSEINIDPGDRWTLISTLGYIHKNDFKLIGGWIASESYKLKTGGNSISRSEKSSRSWYLTAETLSQEFLNYRITLSEQGPWQGQNSSSYASVTFAIMKGFL